MNQVELELPHDDREHADATGFRIGWDHAHRGLVPPPELLVDGTPIGEGWRAARAVFGGRSMPWPANRHTRRWLALRIEAWRAGAAFDLATVTPNHLAQIEATRCPARQTALSGGSSQLPDAPVVVRLNPSAAYAAGNLVTLSRAAADAWQGLGVEALVQRARACEAAEILAAQGLLFDHRATHEPAAGLAGADPSPAPTDPAATASMWWRLATLRSLATPLSAAEAARLPLAAMPPNRVRVLNAPQALQVLLTLRLACDDWSARMVQVAARLPAHSLRTDFNLWVGALAPRRLEAQALGRDPVRALEAAWLGERVQRRWHHFVLSLGEVACEQLVRQLAGEKLAGLRTEHLAWEQALDGWSLPATPSARKAPPRRPVVSATTPRPGAPSRAAAEATGAPARPAAPRRTAPTPFGPRLRTTTGLRPAAR